MTTTPVPSTADLAERTLVVIGGSSGQGLAVGRAAAAAGAEVVLVGRSRGRLDQALAELPGRARAEVADMLDAAAMERLFERLGSLDHLVVTAVADEVSLRSPLVEMTDEVAVRSLDKLWGSFHAARSAAPRIRPGGSITFTSSVAAIDPPADGGFAMANAASAAVAALGRSLAAELKPIRVNVVSPGVVDTGVWASMSDAERDRFRTDMAGRLPVGHLGRPEEVASAFLFLMTNTYATGVVLPVDGGQLLT
ncbi:MAG: SDR family oxidoreductase [Actinomycetota bacterium]